MHTDPELTGPLARIWETRHRQNIALMEHASTRTKRFLSLDSQIYRDGALDSRTKEMLGLVSSIVLRCDDCISYHLVQCLRAGLGDLELMELMDVALVVGGSITIPHIRRAIEAWDALDRPPSTSGGIRYVDATEERIPMNNEVRTALLERAGRILAHGNERDEKLLKITMLLRDEVEHYDWVGFYLVDPEKERELRLGPYVGDPTQHTSIAFGAGICGQAAETKEAFIVQDVTQVTNYLSCSPSVRSEIVIPILRDGKVLGELDIDSHETSPFNDIDRELLEAICRMLEPLL